MCPVYISGTVQQYLMETLWYYVGKQRNAGRNCLVKMEFLHVV